MGAATPSFAPWVFGVVCLIAGATQVLGLIGVAKVSNTANWDVTRPTDVIQEKPVLFRRYLTLHSILIAAAFALAAAWAIISASRHSTAQANCIKEFFDASDSAQQAEAKVLCNIFPWVDVGIMGGLWVVLAVMHVS